ncbi:MAG: molybdopterin-dependent oxidoreductase [bacterium]
MPDPKKPPHVEQKTLTRRTWLEWMGKATVLSLGAGVLAGCDSNAAGDTDGGGGPDGGGGVDAAPGVDSGPTPDAYVPNCTSTPADYPFTPGAELGEFYERWWERTVDSQDLQWILDNWQLTVDGMVGSSRILTFPDILALPRQDQLTDFHCVEGWSVHDVPWNGVHLSNLFDLVQPSSSATYVTFHTIDGRYNESLPIDIALEPKTLLGYGAGCSTLPLKHGFPLRVVIPRLLGYKNAKYVHRIELTDQPLNGYWVARGYPYDGEVPASRLREGKY